jgi:hypothetical protein
VNLHNFSQRNGATINLWVQNGHDSQKWVYEDGAIKLAANRNFCINLHNFSKTNGAEINLWTYTGHQSQKWDICDGKIKLHSDHRWVLNLHYMSLKSGATVNLWSDNGHASQKWSTGPRFYALFHRATLFHVSPTTNRASIARNGLRPASGRAGTFVYCTFTEGQARRIGEKGNRGGAGKFDIWSFSVDQGEIGSVLEHPPWAGMDTFREVLVSSIPAHRLTRL